MAGICGCGSLFPLPFLLKEKEQKFKADIIGPYTRSERFPAMSAVARAPNPVGLWRSHTQGPLLSLPFLTARSRPLPSSRAFPLSKGVPEGRGIKVPRSPMLLGFTPVVASRHREARSDPFMPDLCKICFKKSSINFIPSYLPDNKRLQTTTVDYKRLING